MKKLTHITKRKINAFIFTIPWIIGFVIFFLVPLVNTIIYSFCEVGVKDSGGIQLAFSGIQNYINLFTVDVSTQNQPILRLFADENLRIALNTPVIVVFSLFLAIIANVKFKGRGVVRLIFFLPIVLGIDIVVSLISVSSGGGDISAVANAGLFGDSSIAELLLQNTGLPPFIAVTISNMVSGIFTLIIQAGVQTLIYLAGLQSISPSYYEVAKIEGATSYEAFWKVTLPSLATVTVFVAIYTLIDMFLASTVAVEVYNFAFTKSKIGVGSALSVVYIINVFIALSIILLILRKAVAANARVR